MSQRESTILVADDDAITRKTVTKVLQSEGYQITDVDTGERVLDLFTELEPDLVLMDVMMPGRDGIDICAELRSRYGDRVPVIMLTSLNDVAAVGRAFDAGATDFITKPINYALLSQRVRYALRSAQLLDKLQLQQKRLAHAQLLARLGYWEYNFETGRVVCAGDLAGLLLGPKEDDSIEVERFIGLLDEVDRDDFRQRLESLGESGGTFVHTGRLILDDGSVLIVQQHGEAMHDRQNRIIGVAGTLQDITAQKQAEMLVEFQRNHDHVTGLANRTLFDTHIAQLVESYIENDGMISVAYIGVDQLKQIHEGLGRRMGEGLEKAMANRLRNLEAEVDMVARIDAGLFAVVCSSWESAEAAHSALEALRQQLGGGYPLGKEQYMVTVSIGVVFYPFDAESDDVLLQKAEAALSLAKTQGGNQLGYYADDVVSKIQRRLTIEKELHKELHKVIEQIGLDLHFQPQIDIESGAVVGAEALLRWTHSELGYIPPPEYVHIAEECGLIGQLGQWVAEESMRRWAKLSRETGTELRLAINVSAMQFTDPELVPMLHAATKAAGLRSELIEVEITETQAMHDIALTTRVLLALKGIGIGTVIDDFGTGYCSLAYIQKLPIAGIKIDRSFLGGSDIESTNWSLVKAIIAMCKSIDLNVLAEGIESEEQMSHLKQLECDEGQGYLMGRPMPIEDLIRTMQEQAS
ncbi:hypothetical protein BOW53_06410 [Solemya pervernicosa gill symbiont]|uniref:Diguanylate cyclase n=2 Tax=Gammaproteobacteria incertae sedis TaxID=118884 RepID=A0A1T2L724_9GAMM|nr:EAL domain-containing response regulator [Candidatus Reidiella endopervernicosa]OOZ40746.1 hypothetical protein BOW53_06410 [Solemya pervernicosa gill symbiont]QKQ26425.1 EAL domain-containing protein [Candidatus Reidiella endopervernicosa]